MPGSFQNPGLLLDPFCGGPGAEAPEEGALKTAGRCSAGLVHPGWPLTVHPFAGADLGGMNLTPTAQVAWPRALMRKPQKAVLGVVEGDALD